MLDGKNRIGFQASAEGDQTFKVFSPVKGDLLPQLFYAATAEELNKAVRKAKQAQRVYRTKSNEEKASFLRAIADEIDNRAEGIINTAALESGLTRGRLTGECMRTTNQLKLFAQVVEEGSWVEATIDPADPKRAAPKPDIRKMLVPLGIVGVFTASNFPLAFSTAGGDTASALASGNAVIVKAHPYHAGTNELVANAILEAAKKTGMPDGIFSSLNAVDFSIGQALVTHPDINAISFTGSFRGGRALYDLAQTRKDLIPVFTEMGSINPVVILPEQLEKKPLELAQTLASSIVLGSGQFCTNPGFMVVMKGKGLDELKLKLKESIEACIPQLMLHPNIRVAYGEGLDKFNAFANFKTLATAKTEPKENESGAAIGYMAAKDFILKPALAEEVFGPFSLLVECDDEDEVLEVLESLKGQLTTTVMGTDNDVKTYQDIVDRLRDIGGRLIFNGVPTGVEVGYAMHHGGPYPATTDGRFTSVGVDAVKRFARPVAFQDAPDEYLPPELKNRNERNIWRKIDGQLSRESIT
ncbi:aldehyde dehydrogenase (NADP(+)) [Prolixibacter sp. NT017]|uniref:aldehyde dehydrogenase (NADP(+)) n=1 Tax=Prolixibacter sp. NT017 TaxID=2652390 RepID=UPI0012861F0E|nr:aldehyde dehydrogenase (NADP(+)) [Prolixibacter sp. NT017]GET25584.1 semialdehyde dehydrogenase [Prolixibacter sp. NT017]